MTGRDWMEQALTAKAVARLLWVVLHRSLQIEVVDELGRDGVAVVDAAFDAALLLWQRERILVQPCRRVHDGQPEIYSVSWPGGEHRFMSRDQVVMLGGSTVGDDPARTDPSTVRGWWDARPEPVV